MPRSLRDFNRSWVLAFISPVLVQPEEVPGYMVDDHSFQASQVIQAISKRLANRGEESIPGIIPFEIQKPAQFQDSSPRGSLAQLLDIAVQYLGMPQKSNLLPRRSSMRLVSKLRLVMPGMDNPGVSLVHDPRMLGHLLAVKEHDNAIPVFVDLQPFADQPFRDRVSIRIHIDKPFQVHRSLEAARYTGGM